MWLYLAACFSGVPRFAAEADVDLDGAQPAAAEADTRMLVVDCGGGGDVRSVQEAIDGAADGDLIRVRPCAYAEAIDFRGHTVRVEAIDGPAVTLLDGDGGGTVVTAAGVEGDGTALVGFTLTGGAADYGSALVVDFAALRVEDAVLTGNAGWATIYTHSADLELDSVTLVDNTDQRGGAAVYMDRGTLVMDRSSVTCGNRADYALYLGHGTAFVDWSTLTCDTGSAATFDHTVGRIQRSVVNERVHIESEEDHYDDLVALENDILAGGVYAHYGYLRVRNSVVEGGGVQLVGTSPTTAIEGSILQHLTCGIDADTDDFLVRYNTFWDTGTSSCGGVDRVGLEGNVAVDPELDADWRPAPDSPVIDAGPPEAELSDVDGSRNDIGVYGGPRSIGGGW